MSKNKDTKIRFSVLDAVIIIVVLAIAASLIFRYTLENNLFAYDTEKYTVTGDSVQYKVERLNAFTPNGDSYNVPDSYKTVEEKVLTPEEQKNHNYSLPNFKFVDSALGTPTISGGTLNASIISIKNFMGKDIDAENAVLKVSYSPNSIGYISVSYTTGNGNRVTIKYTF